MNVVDRAFSDVSRADFLPDGMRDQAQWDMPLPIGFGQTNSQPTTVRLMLEWLDPKPGQKILDVGSGSGWSSALLADIVGSNGHVYSVEKVPKLVEFGRQNCQKTGLGNVDFFHAGRRLGLTQFAPYDRILVSAAARRLPFDLLAQLKIGGKMVIPINSDVLEIKKIGEAQNEIVRHPGFAFVPLIKNGE